MTALRWLAPRARWLLPTAGLLLVSASCGVRPTAAHPAHPAHPAQPSHPLQPSRATALIFGVVAASPGCPVQRPNHPCPPRPLGGVRVEAGSLPAGVTASTRTRANGHYALRLAAGRYVLVAVMGQAVPRCPRVLVSVTAPGPVRADIKCDSGIR